MRDTFVKTLTELALRDPAILLITGDLGFGVLKPYWEAVPEQFLNAGITEQAMTTMAAGMARMGRTVVTYSIGNFPTLRCYEQIRNDCAYHDADVKIVCVGGGFTYGALGMSHHATEDLAVMRSLPNVVVLSPGDALEAEAAVRAMMARKGTCYLRLGRGGEMPIHPSLPQFQIGKAIPVREGRDAAIFFTGGIYEEVALAVQLLENQGIRPAVYSFPTVSPLDEELVRECTENYRLILTCEEHSIFGGFGSAVAEVMAEHPGKALLRRIGIRRGYSPVAGDQKYLRRQYGLDGASIAETVRNCLWKNEF